MGYLLAVIVQFSSAYCLVVFVAFMLSFFVGSCWTLMAVTVDIKQDVKNLDKIGTFERNNKKLKEKLCEFITLSVDAKQ